MPPSSFPTKIRCVTLSRRKPALSIADLAMLLEIDCLMGNHNTFQRRLHKALEDAFRQGAAKPH